MRWKWILIALAALVVAAVLSGYLILRGYDFNSLKPRMAQAVKEATGRELKIGGPVELEVGLNPSLVVTNLGFENAPWGSRPELAKVERVELRVALLPLLRREIVVKRLVIIGPDLLLETDKQGNLNLPSAGAGGAKVEPGREPAGLKGLSLGEVLIRKGRLVYKGKPGGEVRTVELDELSLKGAGALADVKVRAQGREDGRPFQVSGTLGAPWALLSPSEEWPLDLKGKALDQEFSLQGKLNRSRAGVFRLAGIRLRFGESDLEGWVEVDLKGPRPELRTGLTSKKLDLKPYLASTQAPAGAEKAKPGGKVFSREPLPLGWLRDLEAKVDLKAAEILHPKLALANLNAQVELKGGRLKVEPLTALVGGGKLEGRVDLRAEDKGILAALTIKIDQLDLGRMLKELKLKEDLSGEVDLEADLKARGGSVAELMAGLDGFTKVVLGHGRLDNRYLDLLGGDLGQGVFRLLNPFKEDKETTINCLVSRFDIKAGQAESTALLFDTSRMTVVGEGRIDLAKEKLDLGFKPNPKEGAGTDTARVGLSLGELAKPLKLSGTLAEPALGLDAGRTMLTMGKAVGGVALFGPVGLIAALASGGSGKGNPCLEALEQAKSGAKPKSGKEQKGKTEEKGSLEKAAEGIGGALKGLVGK